MRNWSGLLKTNHGSDKVVDTETMSVAPPQLKTTSSILRFSTGGIADDRPFDETHHPATTNCTGNQKALTLHARHRSLDSAISSNSSHMKVLGLPPISPSNLDSWWHMLMHDGPADELEADSYNDRMVIPRKSTSKSTDYDSDGHPSFASSTKKVHWQHPIQKTRKYKKDEANNKMPTDTSSSTDGGIQCYLPSTTKLFDMLSDNACTSDNFESPTLRQIEQHIEDKLCELDHAALWSIVDPSPSKSPDHKAINKSKKKTSKKEVPASPVESDASFDFVPKDRAEDQQEDILSDLQDDVAILKTRSNLSGTKYKSYLKQNREELYDPEDEPYANAGKLKGKKKKDMQNAMRKTSMIPATFELDMSKVDEAAELVNGMSSLTEDSAKTPVTFDHEHDILFKNEYLSKSCFGSPSFLKKLQLTKSASTAETTKNSKSLGPGEALVRIVTSSDASTGEPQHIYYVYEKESTHHAYVAFFRRGKAARESIRLYEHPRPAEFPTLVNEVVVKVDASTVSQADCSVRRGDWWSDGSRHCLSLPIVPGVAFAGTLVQLDRSGTRTGGLKVGDKVCSLVHVGANARHICILKDAVVKIPDEVDNMLAAACLPEIYVGAFQALHLGQKNAARYRRTSLAGKSVMVLGGASVQGRALIELAKAAGCTTIYATGRECHFKTIQDLGAAPIHRDPQHWFSILEGRMDVVVSAEGSKYGKSDLRFEHIKILNRTGQLVDMSVPEHEEKTVISLDKVPDGVGGALGSNRQLHSYNVFDAWDSDVKLAKRDLSHLLKLLEERLIEPHILDRLPLNKVARAQDMIEHKNVHGFIICEPWVKGKRKEEYLKDQKLYSESASKDTLENTISGSLKSRLASKSTKSTDAETPDNSNDQRRK